jgi:vesicle coat complex subunit
MPRRLRMLEIYLRALLIALMRSLPRSVISSIQRYNSNRSKTQLQILTAVVKLFLKKPEGSQALVQRVLQAATAENDNPDIRDRAYVYWRLLSSDAQVTRVSLKSMMGGYV